MSGSLPAVVVASSLGPGWRSIVERCAQELTRDDPAATLVATISPEGLLALRVRSKVLSRFERRHLARRYANEAARTCESCGSPGGVRSGVILSIRCPGCV